jgi:tRNA G18 (ribose-2'-O)-methylase SpoU
MRKLRNEELGRKSVEEFRNSEKIPVIVVLDNVRSALNVGSVFRTSDAFLIEGICLCGITAIPPNPEIHKTALGGEISVYWKHFSCALDAVDELRANGYTIYSVEQADKSISLRTFKPEKRNKYALIFGNEVEGVQQEVINKSDACIEIPQWGSKHSLNISVSVGIVLWDIISKMNTR